jgi:hypothetical protein
MGAISPYSPRTQEIALRREKGVRKLSGPRRAQERLDWVLFGD